MLHIYSHSSPGMNLIQNYSCLSHFHASPSFNWGKSRVRPSPRRHLENSGDGPFLCLVNKNHLLSHFSGWCFLLLLRRALSDIRQENIQPCSDSTTGHTKKGASHLTCKGDCVATATRIRKGPGCWLLEIHSGVFRRQCEQKLIYSC